MKAATVGSEGIISSVDLNECWVGEAAFNGKTTRGSFGERERKYIIAEIAKEEKERKKLQHG